MMECRNRLPGNDFRPRPPPPGGPAWPGAGPARSAGNFRTPLQLAPFRILTPPRQNLPYRIPWRNPDKRYKTENPLPTDIPPVSTLVEARDGGVMRNGFIASAACLLAGVGLALGQPPAAPAPGSSP